jgi:hypothetical protein
MIPQWRAPVLAAGPPRTPPGAAACSQMGEGMRDLSEEVHTARARVAEFQEVPKDAPSACWAASLPLHAGSPNRV